MKTPLHRRSMEVRRSGLWAPDTCAVENTNNKSYESKNECKHSSILPETENSLQYLREKMQFLGMTVIFNILSIFTVVCIFAIF